MNDLTYFADATSLSALDVGLAVFFILCILYVFVLRRGKL